jgi:hypothetical protein
MAETTIKAAPDIYLIIIWKIFEDFQATLHVLFIFEIGRGTAIPGFNGSIGFTSARATQWSIKGEARTKQRGSGSGESAALRPPL